ncbi:hypothetical protein DPX16_9127 [Anabarilius grahami]|uniref:Uncharacterized protein n=1 Tax=Anabarilius grahami TaxID=495550 RepID=A0A3N0YF76_ANAGA|nr:hypothetical protein DPX16_9127 [Anabarilius grahami]
MAEQSPAKKLRSQVKGFLCDVSPIKNTKAPYFDAILQHEGEYSKVVPSEQKITSTSTMLKPPVTLEDVILQPSVEPSRKMDVFYTHSSTMSCVRDLGEAFKNSSSPRPQGVQLSELLNSDTKSKRVIINAKIIQEVHKGNSFVWDGRYLPRTKYTVADTTGYMSLTVWCEHNITVGEWGHLELKPETGNVVEVNIEDEVIRSVLTVEPRTSREDVIQSFIALPPMQITIRENIIVKMEDVPQKAEIKSDAELPVKVEPVEESSDFYSPPDHGFLFSSQVRKRKSTN